MGDPNVETPAVRKQTMRPEITGQMGIVAAGRHYAVSAGMRMFEAGGNAFDAGAAAVFAASVTEFNLFGFGGESPVILYDAASKKVVVINGQGSAPKAAVPAVFEKMGYVEGNGPLGATMPAVMDAMAIVLQKYGTMTLEQVMQPAIEYADGFVMYEYLQSAMVQNRKATEAWNEWGGPTYYPGGKTPQVGEVFRQPNLAATLRRIVAAEKAVRTSKKDRVAAIQAGRDDFYKGETAKKIAAAQKAAGGVMTYEDMATYTGRIEEPVSVKFHDLEVFKCGFWDQGPVLLQALNILEGFDLAKMGFNSAEYIHTVTEAMKLAYEDRNTFYGDPQFVQVPAKGLLSKEYAAVRRAQIVAKAELGHHAGDPYAFDPSVPRPSQIYMPHTQGKVAGSNSDTTSIAIGDAKGNLFSCTPSSGWIGRGAFIAGDTGVPMSNRMTVFDLDPLSPNVLAGGKRPRTTLTPSIVFKNGKPYMAIGTPGGDNQDQQILNVLLAHSVFKMGLQEAIESPRLESLHFHASFFNHMDQPGVLRLENRIPADVRKELTDRGHTVKLLGAFGMSTGIVIVAIRQDTGTLIGAADPRRERYVFGW
ncbi:MAG TPA: gamma-glutamyltransferase family protein [Opitutaceae bacterium]|nr:gamma-glutamyltransferase family protein [Opitutaceae bacterium]